MDQHYNVLVFPAGTEMANEITNSLKCHKNFELFFASSEACTYCHYLNIAVEFLPYVTNKDFLSELRTLIYKNNIQLIIPAHDDVAYVLAQLENHLSANVIGQSSQVNEIVRFKDKTYKFFNGFLPLPKVLTQKPSSSDYPVFVKPKQGQGSFNAFKVSDAKAYENFLLHNDSDKFVVLEHLPGEEFTVDCFSHEGEVLYFGARSRDKIARGIAMISSFVADEALNREFAMFAKIISRQLNMHGVWFYQVKFDENHVLKLLEIGPRVSGTMGLNRGRGVNFVELAIYQSLNYPIEIVQNNITISLARALKPVYKHDIEFAHLYIDFDDTLFLKEKHINVNLIKLIFQMKNEGKQVMLITKNYKNNLNEMLNQFGIHYVFDDIIHLRATDIKSKYMEGVSILIDDSFVERKQAIQAGHYAFSIDNFDVLFKEQV